MSGVRSILVLGTQVPYTRGGAEVLLDTLVRELQQRGYEVDQVNIPFCAEPKDLLVRQTAIWRSLPLHSFAGRDVDMVICTKFPTYAVQHPRKVLWLIHQHRQLYELYGTRYGDFSTSDADESLRRTLLELDKQFLLECESRFTISSNVSKRLERYVGLESQPLEPPLPLGNRYVHAEHTEPFILSVGRLCSIKRVDLLLKALPSIDESISLRIVGSADEPAFQDYLESEVRKHQLWHRVQFLGRVSETELLDLFSQAFVTAYVPYDEDYGFVTLESLASGTPVLTTRDSGAVLSFVRDEVNGLVVDPDEVSLASAVNRLWAEPDVRERLAANARAEKVGTDWDDVLEQLLGGPRTAAGANALGAQ